MKDTFGVQMNRAEKRRLNRTVMALPKTSLQVTRHNNHVCIGIEEPGFVQLTDDDARELIASLTAITMPAAIPQPPAPA